MPVGYHKTSFRYKELSSHRLSAFVPLYKLFISPNYYQSWRAFFCCVLSLSLCIASKCSLFDLHFNRRINCVGEHIPCADYDAVIYQQKRFWLFQLRRHNFDHQATLFFCSLLFSAGFLPSFSGFQWFVCLAFNSLRIGSCHVERTHYYW